MKTDILVPNVDINLLRKQRDELIHIGKKNIDSHDEIEGLINLLDAMLDIAEGYELKTNVPMK